MTTMWVPNQIVRAIQLALVEEGYDPKPFDCGDGLVLELIPRPKPALEFPVLYPRLTIRLNGTVMTIRSPDDLFGTNVTVDLLETGSIEKIIETVNHEQSKYYCFE